MSLWRTLLPRPLTNTGSTARDHLASERTFLAWQRTGLGILALGIAVERFSQLDVERLLGAYTAHTPGARDSRPNEGQEARGQGREGHVNSKGGRENSGKKKGQEQLLVGALVGTGAGSIVYGTVRYFSNMRALERGLFKPALGGAGALSLAMIGVVGAVVSEGVGR